ncbi:retinitis pigmentosa 9 protein-like [Corticium candelabrum]|uniref:retinitis pigmentosa 9 protein-like n=1 Tax=Corticium candelabrum TaxID=121492 RepID=UPI002E272D0D|nr:retinitis pigmentosa 9 protein-like [Corticium candelabrum]
MSATSGFRKERKRSRGSSTSEAETAKHIETFYEAPPPGIVQEEEEKPEDCIPDLPQNKDAREFLAHAPSKGLWMPLGKEVKVMQCWRCKAYGHRTGDRECPFFLSGNTVLEKIRTAHEDPMYSYVKNSKKEEKLAKVEQLKRLLDESSDSTDSETERKHKHKKRRTKKSKRDHNSDQNDKKKHKEKSRKKLENKQHRHDSSHRKHHS